MKSFHPVFVLLPMMACLVASVFAADPTGTWTWSQPAPGAAAFASSREATLVLEVRDGFVTGSLSEVDGESTPIEDARLQGDNLSFTVSSSLHGTVSYSGRIDDDTIRGSMVIPGIAGGEDRTIDWVAVKSR